MQFKTIAKVVGLLLLLFSTSMLTPMLVNLIYRDDGWMPYVISFLLTSGCGFLLWYPCRNSHYELKTRDGFLVVSLFWIVLCFFAAFPFLLSLHPTNGLTDSMFESISGFTTTGASVIPKLSTLPHAILFYRQQLQFIGGMGIVVLAVAVLPVLGVGGMQLCRAETPGPIKDAKLAPRIAESAKTLWLIYLGFGLICTLCFKLAGMSLFDAIGETFATISTGGFAVHDNSFAYYNNTLIEIVAMVFMLLGGINFALHFVFFQQRRVDHYFRDEEFKVFILMILIGCACVIATLMGKQHHFSHPAHMISKMVFNVISLSTTTGLTAMPMGNWPIFASVLLFFLTIIGGCAASTSGGIKMMRFLLLLKGIKREIVHLIHPHALHNIKFGDHTLPRQAIQSMWGFLSVYIGLLIIFILLMLALDNDLLTSFSASTAALANSGVGLGKASVNFATLSVGSKWLMMFGMLLGRLEIFSLLVLFTPMFWQK